MQPLGRVGWGRGWGGGGEGGAWGEVGRWGERWREHVEKGGGACTYNYVCEVWVGQMDAIVCGCRVVHDGVWMVAKMKLPLKVLVN